MASIESLLNAANLPDSPTPRLDAELLLAAALDKQRSYLRTWPEREPDAAQQALFDTYLQRRHGGEPVAYILGQQGFWSLDLEVASHTLIPRPDTELLVETALELLPATPLAGSHTLRSPVPGVLVFHVAPGAQLTMGDVVADVIDPTAAGQARVHPVRAEVDGVHYAAVSGRYVVAGGEVGKIAGAHPFRSGDLLGA